MRVGLQCWLPATSRSSEPAGELRGDHEGAEQRSARAWRPARAGRAGSPRRRRDRRLVPRATTSASTRRPTCARSRREPRRARSSTAPATSVACARSSTATVAGDQVYFLDFRGDIDERLDGPGTEVGEVLAGGGRARRRASSGCCGAPSPSALHQSEEANAEFVRHIADHGGQVLLDARTRRAGSHHQKLVVIRHPRPAGPGRRVRRRHRPRPQPQRRLTTTSATRR